MRAVLALAGALFLAASCGSDGDRPVVFAASSLTVVTEELDEVLEADGAAPPEWVLAGSSRLVEQVLDGARPDLVITADPDLLQPILDADLGYEPGPVTGLANVLALAIAPGNPGDVTELADLEREDALIGWCAEPVPCGRVARASMADHGIEVAADTEEPNARALATKLAAGELDAALIYQADARDLDLRIVAFPLIADHCPAVAPLGAAVRTGSAGEELAAQIFAADVYTAAGFGTTACI